MRRQFVLMLFNLTAFLCIGDGGYAASFDCAKAATPTEIAICSDQLLSSLDSDLATAFRDRRSDTPQVVEAQRRWIKARDALCSGVTTEQFKRCIRSTLSKRIGELKASSASALSFDLPPLPSEIRPTEPPVTVTPTVQMPKMERLKTDSAPPSLSTPQQSDNTADCPSDWTSAFKGCFIDFSASGDTVIRKVTYSNRKLSVRRCLPDDSYCGTDIIARDLVDTKTTTTREGTVVRQTTTFKCIGGRCIGTSSETSIGCGPRNGSEARNLIEKCFVSAR